MNKKILGIGMLIVSVALIFMSLTVLLAYQPAQYGSMSTKIELNCYVWHYDKNSNLISYSHHPMTTVDQGKDWIEQQLFNSNSSQNALYISLSNDETAVSTAWTIVPNEIANNGLARAEGTYASTGVGASNVTYTFSATGSVSCCMYGLNYDTVAQHGTSLIAAEQQGSGNRKNLASGDTLKVTIQWTGA
jgi:hypothetical protein